MENTRALARLGPVSLFLGIETVHWTPTQFQAAARFAHAAGITTLLVKVADGTNVWYGGLAAFQQIAWLIKAEGVQVVPYCYSYGNKFGALATELSIIEQFLAACGCMCVDLESEWNGETGWAQTFAARLTGHNGDLYLSCLADPATSAQNAMLQQLAPAVSVWMPQIYDDYLQEGWREQFAAIGLAEASFCATYDLSNEFGVNHPLAALQANRQISPHISLWEYQTANGSEESLLAQIVSTVKGWQSMPTTSVPLSSTGEIGVFRDVDQFQPAKTQFACGFFSGAIIKAMAPVGSQPTQSVATMIAEAETWYAEADGSNAASNTDGMSLQAEYDLITQKMGLHYQASSLDVPTIRAWVHAGYPIMLTIAETSVYDLALGRNPYPWNPAGSHIIVVSGVASDNNFLVRDPANCTDLYNPNSLRPGPRHYDAGKLQIWTATVVVPAWKPRPTSAIPPTGENAMSIPQGWHEETVNGEARLVAPNGHYAIAGFRQQIENDPNWDPANQPNEEEYQTPQVQLHNLSLGPGSRMTCRDGVLWYTPAKGAVYEPFLGLELKACYDLIATQQSEIATLKAASVPPPAPDITAAIAALHSLQSQLQSEAQAAIMTALKALGASA